MSLNYFFVLYEFIRVEFVSGYDKVNLSFNDDVNYLILLEIGLNLRRYCVKFVLIFNKTICV